jgi:heme/copper-type cytochrome/quinol oxidase subunit 3
MSRPRIVGDLSTVPTFDFGPRNLIWWGTSGFMLIEGMGFVLAAGCYLYLVGRAPEWPPADTAPPDLLWGTLQTVGMLLSAVPNHMAKKAAFRFDKAASRFWVAVMIAIAAVLLIIRGFELPHLNCRWDLNAYGSIVWAVMLLHTAHLITDGLDTAALGYFVFTEEPPDGERFVDVSDNANYWDFVVVSWLPIYLLIYWAPRWL